MQRLSGRLIDELQEALLDAYPARDDLRMMVRVELDEQLEAIADGANQRIVIFNLVNWAERTGRLEALVQGAQRKNMGNPSMQQFLRTWQAAALPTKDQASASLPNISDPVSIDVFLSYTRKDGEVMRTVQEELRAAGLAVWTDEGLEAGTSGWRSAIEEAVEQASVIVALLSPDAKASQWVNNEISYALTRKKPVFPILIAGDTDVAVPISLINVQWVDGRRDLQQAVERDLLPALRGRFGLAQLAVRPPGAEENSDAAAAAAAPTASLRQRHRSTRRQLLIVGLITMLPLVIAALGLYLVDRAQRLLEANSAGSLGSTPPAAAQPATATPAATVGENSATTAIAATPAGAASLIDSSETMINPQDGAVYVRVPAGRFIMGSDDATQEAADDEKPQQRDQYVDAFWIMRTEVTIAQYAKCVQAGACFEHHYDPTRPNDPARVVTWYEASDYAAWAGGRLPTEAEWEKACRGSEGLLYPWGNDALTTERANFGRNVNNNATAVGSYPAGASPYGLLDMTGNVAEWTSSQYRLYPYSASDGREDASGDANRTVRGGGWASFRGDLHCAARAGIEPDSSTTGIGFRVVLR